MGVRASVSGDMTPAVALAPVSSVGIAQRPRLVVRARWIAIWYGAATGAYHTGGRVPTPPSTVKRREKCDAKRNSQSGRPAITRLLATTSHATAWSIFVMSVTEMGSACARTTKPTPTVLTTRPCRRGFIRIFIFLMSPTPTSLLRATRIIITTLVPRILH